MQRRYAPMADVTWDQWVYLESRKRKLIVWFIMSLIFSTQTGIPCSNVNEIRMLPLPATRRAWLSCDQSEWQQHLALERGRNLQTLGDLMDAHTRTDDPLAAKELDAWNAQSDELGSLLNVAITILQ
jgi:hypothetical protein